MNLPNLAGVASKDLVEKIGSGKFSAAYINWSRTMNLLRQHAPGWLVDYVPAEDGSLLHRAPVGAYLLIRFQNMETGAVTPALPQAVMDNRNKSIPFDKIEARDVTDTQRRGMCMAAAMHFGLAYELWAKMPMENGYAAPSGDEERPLVPSRPAPVAAKRAPTTEKAAPPTGGTSEASEATFRETCLECGLTTHACDGLLGVINGDFAKGITTLKKKSPAEVEGLNTKFAPADEGEQW
jgi:hypothetical protein